MSTVRTINSVDKVEGNKVVEVNSGYYSSSVMNDRHYRYINNCYWYR